MTRQINILLVEDNALDAMIFERTLRKVDAEAVLIHAQDGIEALSIVNAEHATKTLSHPYFIVLDINMPRMNGHEFLDALRNGSVAPLAMVFMFSTSASSIDITAAYEEGANGYIVKPKDSGAMRTTLETLCSFWQTCGLPGQEVREF